MRFWCSNDGSNWTWSWQPYWGAWGIVAAIAFAFYKGGAFKKEHPRNKRIGVVIGHSRPPERSSQAWPRLVQVLYPRRVSTQPPADIRRRRWARSHSAPL